MVALSSTGEVGTFIDADQFQWKNGQPLSQMECGFFAVAICRAMGQVGKPPTQTVAQVIAEAEAWYAQYDGNDSITNTSGMTTTQLYDLLHQVGLHYQATATDIHIVEKWLAVGYPVIVGVIETSVFDLALNHNPYTSWKPEGSHVIVITGLKNGNVLVRDSANCTNLHDPNSLRPGPRLYDAAKLQLISATVCVPPWMPRPASATPPEPVVAPAPKPKPTEPAVMTFNADDLHIWSLLKDKLYTGDLETSTGIALDWLAARRQGKEIGPPLGPEFAGVIEDHVSFQHFAGGLAKWNHLTHTCTWFDARGAFVVAKS